MVCIWKGHFQSPHPHHHHLMPKGTNLLQSRCSTYSGGSTTNYSVGVSGSPSITPVQVNSTISLYKCVRFGMVNICGSGNMTLVSEVAKTQINIWTDGIKVTFLGGETEIISGGICQYNSFWCRGSLRRHAIITVKPLVLVAPNSKT